MTDTPPSTAALEAADSFPVIALGLEYNGAAYRGFQRQINGVPSVQQSLEEALSKVAGGVSISVQCAGRTDAGVHASSQVVNFSTTVERPMRAWVMGANQYLPSDISVTWAQEMPAGFNARYNARARRYRYVIYNDPVRPAHLFDGVTWSFRPLDVERMRRAAQSWLGTHDFSAFRAAECQAKSPIKTLYHFDVQRHGQLIILDVRASAFLHHMVRNFAGVLMAIGAGDKPESWAAEVLASCSRKAGGVTAPPYGLYLVEVEYPEEFSIPKRPIGPHFLSWLPDPYSVADKAPE